MRTSLNDMMKKDYTMPILLATRNAHKLQEIREMLPGVELIGTDAYPEVPDPIEDGETFEANAAIKAIAWAKATGLTAIADDSGLEVDALNGAPGIHSARYAGEHGNTAANNAKLLRELEGVPAPQRTARFVCALALATPDGVVKTLRGACEGAILADAAGANGFGYDPLFVPAGYTESFGVLPDAVKAGISHRAKAFMAAREQWTDFIR
jgi:XTP/dITP diphosphohydrolase